MGFGISLRNSAGLGAGGLASLIGAAQVTSGPPPTGASLTYLYTASTASSGGATKTIIGVSLGSAIARRVYVMGVWVDAAGVSRKITSASIGGVSATIYSPLNTDTGGTSPSAQVFAASLPSGITTGDITFTLDGTTVFTNSTMYVYQVDQQISGLASSQFYAGDTIATGVNISLATGVINSPNGAFSLSFCALSTSQAITGWGGDFVPISPATAGTRFGAYKNSMTAESSKTFSASWVTSTTAFMRAWIFNK